MRLKNAIKLLFANFGSIYKLFLYRCIVFFALALVCSVFVMPNLEYFVVQSKISELISSCWNVLRSIFNPAMEFSEMQAAFSANLNHFNAFVKSNITYVYAPVAVVAAFYLAGSFLSKLGDYATGEILNEHMSTLATRGFCVCLFKNFGAACLFALLDLLVDIVFTAIGLAAAFAILFFTIEYISLFAIFFAILALLCVNAVVKALFADFMPKIVADDAGVWRAFCESLKNLRRKFGGVFSNYFSINMIMLYLNVSFAVCTFFTGLIITLPMTVVISLCFKFVNYFTLNGKKFYLSYDEIVTPKAASADSDFMTNISE